MCRSPEVAARKVAHPSIWKYWFDPNLPQNKSVEEVTPMKTARGKPKTFIFVIEKKR